MAGLTLYSDHLRSGRTTGGCSDSHCSSGSYHLFIPPLKKVWNDLNPLTNITSTENNEVSLTLTSNKRKTEAQRADGPQGGGRAGGRSPTQPQRNPARAELAKEISNSGGAAQPRAPRRTKANENHDIGPNREVQTGRSRQGGPDRVQIGKSKQGDSDRADVDVYATRFK